MQTFVANQANGSGINEVLNTLPSLIQQTAETMTQNVQDMKNSMANNKGMLDPIQMNQLQMMTQTYTAVVQTWSSIIKQIGDVERSIAGNIGS